MAQQWPVIEPGSHLLFTWTIPGANRRFTARRDAPGFILMWIMLRINDLVERLDGPGKDAVDEGAYNHRYIHGTRIWSYHARAVAADFNWNRHPQGKAAKYTFTARQIKLIRSTLRWVNAIAMGKLAEWGGEWPSHAGSSALPDPMHIQINRLSDRTLKLVAAYFARTKRGKAIIRANSGNKDYKKVMQS